MVANTEQIQGGELAVDQGELRKPARRSLEQEIATAHSVIRTA